jgi:ABC-type oligopeptide transport system, ATPase component
MDLQDEFGLSYLFVSHDLSIVRQISDEINVMYLGRMVETGTPEETSLHQSIHIQKH